MTKFILHSGNTGTENENNREFYNAWCATSKAKNPKILLCYYAREDKEYTWLEQSDKDRFQKYAKCHKAEFKVASKNSQIFLKQLEECDLLYVRGGNPYKVIEKFEPVKKELIKMLDGKVYAGSSAGVMAISMYSRSHEEPEWRPGIGWIPLISFVHFDPKNSEHNKSVQDFKKMHPELDYEYYLIPETEFEIREY